MATSKFLIIRKDLETDPSVVESDGLTIGRLVSNDLSLNHPEVSRTHAGIMRLAATNTGSSICRTPTGRS
ncbi:MAG: FHA domain-containing protein [Vicinamibacterales bacterium]